MRKAIRTLVALVLVLGLILPVATPAMAQSIPSVWTDKEDYAPEETVVITGSGFDANIDLVVRVTRPDGSVVIGDGSFTPGSDTVTTDEVGSFTYNYILDGIFGEYTVDVLQGDTILATTTFTDGTKVGSVSVSPMSLTVTQGTNASYTVTVTRGVGPGSSGAFAATLTVIDASPSIPGGAISFSPQPVSFTSGDNSKTSTLTITTGSLLGTYTFKVKATKSDAAGDYATSSSVTLTVTAVNHAPVMTTAAITSSDAPHAYETSTLSASGSATDADGDSLTYEYEWFVNSSTTGQTGTALTGTYFNKGDSVTCKIRAYDAAAYSNWLESNSISIENSAPTSPVVDVTPNSPVTTDDLLCSIITPSTDADGDSITYSYAWYKDTVLQVSLTTNTVDDSLTSKGETWKCVVTPDDGSVDGPTDDDQVTILNSAPTAPVVDVTPDSPYTTDDLLCSIITPSTDADGDSISYSYAWYKDTVLQVSLTTNTVDDSLTTKGETWKCVVTPDDGSANGPTDDDQVTILNSAPTAPVVDVTPDSPYTTDDLVCSIITPSTDADGDSISYSYAWYKDTVLQVSLTTNTVDDALTTKGEVWKCVVTPDDGSANGPADDDQVTILNSAPTAPVVDVTPDSPYTTDDLVCSIITPSTDADGDSITYSYAWFKDTVLQVSLTTNTVDDSLTAKGEVWKCVVTPDDGSANGPTDDDQVTILNSAPVMVTSTITSSDAPHAYETSTLSASGTATDADGDSLTYEYEWFVNGSTTGQTGTTLTGTYFDKDDSVTCKVRADDGTDYSSWLESNSITIENSAPVMSTATITSSDAPHAYETSTLSASGSATDADGDSLTYEYEWFVNGSTTGQTGTTLTGTYFDKDDSVTCKVRADDGTDYSSWLESNSITIENSAPVMSTATITSSDAPHAYETSTLSASGSATDADGDSLTYEYEWFVNGSTTGQTGTTLTGTYFDKDDSVTCKVRADDGTDYSSWLESNSITIENSKPVMSTATITSSDAPHAYETSTLSASGSATDADGDSLTYEYEWFVNGSTTGQTGTTLTGTYFDKDDSVTCKVRADDGTDYSNWLESNTITIENSAPILDPIVVGSEPVPWGDLLTFIAQATDVDSDTLIFSLIGEPTGASINASSGNFTWTPTSGQIGSHTFTVKVCDNDAASLCDEQEITIAVGRRATTLVYGGDTSRQYSDLVTLSATLTDTGWGTPLAGKTVSFQLGTQSTSDDTDVSGIAQNTLILNQPAGSYTVDSAFAGDSLYLPSSDSDSFTINKETVVITYTGDSFVFTAGPSINTAPVRLACTLAQDPDGYLGDLTLAKVRFELFKFSNSSGTPDQVVGNIPVNATGEALTIVNLGVDDCWTVYVKIEPANAYWIQSEIGMGTLTVAFGSNDKRVTGGGWILDSQSANRKGNFGFTVNYQKTGSPKGNSLYLFRGTDGFNYKVKSNSWNGGGLWFTGTNKAYFSGKCNVQKIDRVTGAIVETFSNYRFTVDIWDGDLQNPKTFDRYAITILKDNGTIWRQIGTPASPIQLGGGNVVIHNK